MDWWTRLDGWAEAALPYAWGLLGASLLLALFSPTRGLLKWIYGDLLTPSAMATLKTLSLWIFWMVKKILEAHWLVMRNLVLPRSVIYPSLERRDADD